MVRKAMVKEGASNTLVILLIVAIVVSVGGVLLNLALLRSLQLPAGIASITGFAAESGTAQFQQNGTASVLITDSGIVFGAGFFNSNTTNSTCSSRGYSVLDSQDSNNGDPRLSPNVQGATITSSCWVNHTVFLPAFPNNDFHRLQNNGTAVLNITAQGNRNARDFICGIGSACNTSLANIQLLSRSKTGEEGACSGATGSYKNLSSGASGNNTIGLCDILAFDDQTDELDIFVNISVPHNTLTGNKTLTITYTAIAAS